MQAFAPVRRKTRRSPIMARQAVLHRDAVCTRNRSGMKRRGKCGTTVGGLTRAPASVVQMSMGNRIARIHCAANRLRIRGAMCVCAHLCSRIALTAFPREVADAQKNPPKPDHGSAGQAASRWCLHAQAFRHEAARKMRNNCRRLDARAGVCCANERQSNRKNPLRGKAAAYSRRGPCHCRALPSARRAEAAQPTVTVRQSIVLRLTPVSSG